MGLVFWWSVVVWLATMIPMRASDIIFELDCDNRTVEMPVDGVWKVTALELLSEQRL